MTKRNAKDLAKCQTTRKKSTPAKRAFKNFIILKIFMNSVGLHLLCRSRKPAYVCVDKLFRWATTCCLKQQKQLLE